MIWIVRGADRSDGRDREVIVRASSKAAAEEAASEGGVLASECERIRTSAGWLAWSLVAALAVVIAALLLRGGINSKSLANLNPKLVDHVRFAQKGEAELDSIGSAGEARSRRASVLASEFELLTPVDLPFKVDDRSPPAHLDVLGVVVRPKRSHGFHMDIGIRARVRGTIASDATSFTATLIDRSGTPFRTERVYSLGKSSDGDTIEAKCHLPAGAIAPVVEVRISQ